MNISLTFTENDEINDDDVIINI